MTKKSKYDKHMKIYNTLLKNRNNNIWLISITHNMFDNIIFILELKGYAPKNIHAMIPLLKSLEHSYLFSTCLYTLRK